MTWMIAAEGGSNGYPMIGAIGLFAGNLPPAGWLAADGSMLALRDYVPLFELIGTTFGGDGASIFALPDLQGRAVVGAGQGATVSIALGQAIEAGPDTEVACLGLNYIVNVSGTMPPDNGDGGFPNSASVLGEFIAYAGPSIPDGWAMAEGQELPIADNEALFQMIGTTFGGDGQIGFGALPDLRGQMIAGPGSQVAG
jgi:microcystin-dependent protein